MAGLSPQHHGQLNRMDVPHEEYETLRREYADDPLALEQIDIYDGSTPYYGHIKNLTRAYQRDDRTAILKEYRWFWEHYPYTATPLPDEG